MAAQATRSGDYLAAEEALREVIAWEPDGAFNGNKSNDSLADRFEALSGPGGPLETLESRVKLSLVRSQDDGDRNLCLAALAASYGSGQQASAGGSVACRARELRSTLTLTYLAMKAREARAHEEIAERERVQWTAELQAALARQDLFEARRIMVLIAESAREELDGATTSLEEANGANAAEREGATGNPMTVPRTDEAKAQSAATEFKRDDGSVVSPEVASNNVSQAGSIWETSENHGTWGVEGKKYEVEDQEGSSELLIPEQNVSTTPLVALLLSATVASSNLKFFEVLKCVGDHLRLGPQSTVVEVLDVAAAKLDRPELRAAHPGPTLRQKLEFVLSELEK
mmetsp:Transcript_24707/g.55642  ORF Transcript_24707/g.55642 Transcript_24707/m.55642 type:complete len:344 (-) Transcript_24707:269-1300(-)